MSEQPEVPELPSNPIAQAVVAASVRKDAEDELLSGTEEDQLIGKEPDPVDMSPAMLQALNTKAMLEVAQAVKQMLEQQNATRQIPYNEIKPTSPWNPEGKRNRAKFVRETFQHGRWVNPMMVSEETIQLFNQLKPGRYLNRKVEVIRSQDGAINITWSNAKIEQRVEFYRNYPTIDHVLRAVIAERAEKERKKKAGEFDDNDAI
jgi:hypothetical protein